MKRVPEFMQKQLISKSNRCKVMKSEIIAITNKHEARKESLVSTCHNSLVDKQKAFLSKADSGFCYNAISAPEN